MSIVKYGEAVLRNKTKPVVDFDDRLRKTIEQMKAKMFEANGVGLAATQVGLDLALFVAKLGEEVYAFVNPVIVPLSMEKNKDEEGCLSVPGVWVEVERFERIRLRAQDPDGKEVDLELEGYHARIVQHEVDHLNGVLIIDRIPPKKRREISEQLDEIARNN